MLFPSDGSVAFMAALLFHVLAANNKYVASAFRYTRTVGGMCRIRITPIAKHSAATFRRTAAATAAAARELSSTIANKDPEQTNNPPLFWTTDKVRSTFNEYFIQHPRYPHTFVPSSPVAPLNDPTLLFTNAGMNQFKPIFLGQVDPSSPLASLKRAVNSQKCIRAGGKHNDLEDVGRDTYHHTFFEMLGTWSFGDYFKKEAIDMAWDILTNVYNLPKDRLYATYFKGDEAQGLEPDLEAKQYWLQYLPEHHVIGCGAKDNFWEMGDTGPCGPCSEIHFDRIGGRDASQYVNADDPNVLEIWNIVFIQYNRDETSKLSTLPSQHIDTGMGLERLASILQGKMSNYDVDIFQPFFEKIFEASSEGKQYEGRLGEEDKDLKDTAFRAIADHVRTLSFAIADGAVPDNVGRGYVLRRILRRAARYGQQILGLENGFFASLVPAVVETFGDAYPELRKHQSRILEIVAEEEQAFSTMLDRGIKYFTELQSNLETSGGSVVRGQDVFFLYDTMGFPLDLTQQMAAEAGLSLDTDGFATEMEAQKQRSRNARYGSNSGDDAIPRLELIAEQTAWLSSQNIAMTDDAAKYLWDVDTEASVKAVYSVDGNFFEEGSFAVEGDVVGLILDKSSFYAEAGGQDADTGSIVIINNDEIENFFEVKTVQSFGGFLVHTGIITKGKIGVGSTIRCRVDYKRRRDIAPNHTMTHVLNAALRSILGDGIEQRGSFCNEDKLRFDFTYKKAMSLEQLRETEEFVRRVIASKETVSSEVLPLADAKAIDGVRAVFGEMYPDPVRVVTVGDDISIEFCGGTHISNSADAEAFALVEESAVAKGIRRISGVTKDAARYAIAEGYRFTDLVSSLESHNSVNGVMIAEDLDKRAGALRKELDSAYISASLKAELRARIEALQKIGAEAKKVRLQQRTDKCLSNVREQIQSASANGQNFLVVNTDISGDTKASQRIMNVVKELAPTMAFMGISEEDPGSGGKLICYAIVPDSMVADGFRADEWVQAALASCGGRGGGKANNAQGQAKECRDVKSVLSEGNTYAKNIVAVH